jgi:hypothetical protein
MPAQNTPSADATAVAGEGVEGLPALLPVPRAATLLGISRASAYRYPAAGELPTQRLGGRVYVVTAGIRHMFSEDRHRPRPVESAPSATTGPAVAR